MRLDLRPEEPRASREWAAPQTLGVCLTALAALAGILASGGVLVYGESMRKRALDLQAEVRTVERAIQASRVRDEEQRLLLARVRRASLSRSVVPISGVLVAIADASENAFTLSRLTLSARPNSGAGAHQSVMLEVEGNAYDAKGVSVALERLSSHPGMSDVRLVSVQEHSTPDGLRQRCVLTAAVRPRLVELLLNGGR